MGAGEQRDGMGGVRAGNHRASSTLPTPPPPAAALHHGDFCRCSLGWLLPWFYLRVTAEGCGDNGQALNDALEAPQVDPLHPGA